MFYMAVYFLCSILVPNYIDLSRTELYDKGMMELKPENRFFEVAGMLIPFENMLLSVPKNISAEATEIRVRTGKPIVIETPFSRHICGTRRAESDEIYACIKNFCDYSIHSCQRELSEGWITLKGGHRAGFTGTAHIRDGRIETIKDISSLNVRISREHTGISDLLFSETAHRRDFHGLIIAGPPLSGKTTFLRDYCRNLGGSYKTAIIDERSEIAAVYKGIPQNNIGLNSDVLNCFTKETGIEQAVRVLSPEYLVCDEVGSDTDVLIKCAGNGVKLVITVHCGDISEAVYNRTILALVDSGAINYIAFLGNGKTLGNLKGLWCVNNGKDIYGCDNGNNLLCDGDRNIGRAQNACYTA